MVRGPVLFQTDRRFIADRWLSPSLDLSGHCLLDLLRLLSVGRGGPLAKQPVLLMGYRELIFEPGELLVLPPEVLLMTLQPLLLPYGLLPGLLIRCIELFLQ